MVENNPIVRVTLERVPNRVPAGLVMTIQSKAMKTDNLIGTSLVIDATGAEHCVRGHSYMPSYQSNVTLTACIRNVECFTRLDELKEGVVFFIRGLATNQQMEEFVDLLEAAFKQAHIRGNVNATAICR